VEDTIQKNDLSPLLVAKNLKNIMRILCGSYAGLGLFRIPTNSPWPRDS
jgi:hypothetical protein